MQLVELGDGVALRRGTLELRAGGSEAAAMVRRIFAMLGPGATIEEIEAQFAEPDRGAVRAFVVELKRRRLVFDADGQATSEVTEGPLDVFYWSFDATAGQVAARLSDRAILVVGVNPISERLLASLAAVGASNVIAVDDPLLRNLTYFAPDGRPNPQRWPAPTRDEARAISEVAGDGVACVVVTSDFGGRHELRRWNERCLERRWRFLPMVLSGPVGHIGPFVIPPETACFECFLSRYKSNLIDRATRGAFDAAAFAGQHLSGYLPPMASILADIAAIEIVKVLGGALPTWNIGKLIEVNLLSTQMVTRQVLKVPRCAACSPLHARGPVDARRTSPMEGPPR